MHTALPSVDGQPSTTSCSTLVGPPDLLNNDTDPPLHPSPSVSPPPPDTHSMAALPFRPTSNTTTTMPVSCRFWLSPGGCRFGASCRFSHVPAEAQPARSLDFTATSDEPHRTEAPILEAECDAVTLCACAPTAPVYTSFRATIDGLAMRFDASESKELRHLASFTHTPYRDLLQALGALDLAATAHSDQQQQPATRSSSAYKLTLGSIQRGLASSAGNGRRKKQCDSGSDGGSSRSSSRGISFSSPQLDSTALGTARKFMQSGASWTVWFRDACCRMVIVPLWSLEHAPDLSVAEQDSLLEALDVTHEWAVFGSIEHAHCQLAWLERQLGLMTISVCHSSGLHEYQLYVAGSRIAPPLDVRLRRALARYPLANSSPSLKSSPPRTTAIPNEITLNLSDDDSGDGSRGGESSDSFPSTSQQRLFVLCKNLRESAELLSLEPLDRNFALQFATATLGESYEEDSSNSQVPCGSTHDIDDDDGDDDDDDDDDDPDGKALLQQYPFIFPFTDLTMYATHEYAAAMEQFLSAGRCDEQSSCPSSASGWLRFDNNVHLLENHVLALTAGTGLQLSDGSMRVMEQKGAGCSLSAQLSEAMSYEVLYRLYGASSLRCETELQYRKQHGFSMIDYRCEIDGVRVGVSVTRAVDGIPECARFTRDAARRLLGKKLRGIRSAAEAVLPHDRWHRSLLHVWASTAHAARLVKREAKALLASDSPLCDPNTLILVTSTQFECPVRVSYLFSTF